MISHLNRKHSVTVASLVRSEEEGLEGEGLRDHCSKYLMARIEKPVAVAQMIVRLPTPVPSSMGYFYSRPLKKKIDSELESTRYDLIFVHCSSVAQYVENITDVPKIIDFGDMDSQKWLEYAKVKASVLSPGYYLEGWKLERNERLLARKFDYCSCTTRAEMETLRSYNVGARTDWFPNGVDYKFFRPTGEAYEKDTLCFIGRMDYYPNQECMVEFCQYVLPLIRQKRPAVKLTIIGADPSEEIIRLSKIEGVTVTGSVPDVRPYVLRSAVNVAPLKIARGTQNKILESLAMGVPVVSSVIAAGGIDAVPGEHFLTASTHQEYADQIIRLLVNPQERERFSQAGRARMLSHHDWGRSMCRLDSLIEKCMRFKRSS